MACPVGLTSGEALEIFGHSRISVTMEIYTHGDGEGRQDALKKVNGPFE
ncbi:hypothetical protein FHR32_002794 [Streptosporangium album]|uniref:Uncharacterized protein n=1 Tax=Streptosporangium album TaxID=47479 RepID=A0A7W7W9W5_9ACTN|nr:hypothetical protein [Streptosporangium album]MBB4938489.1 hypothetical protein [Streptosporangium album]